MRQLYVLRDFRRFLPIIFGSVAGVVILLDRLIPNRPGLEDASGELLGWIQILAAFAVITGVLNVVWLHVGRLRKGDQRWPYSLALLVGLIIPPGLAGYSLALNQNETVYNNQVFNAMLRYVYVPLSVSLLGLLTFFAITAAMRALSAGNREAVVLVIVAGIMLALQLPFLARLPMVGESVIWIQQYLALAGLRGLALGAAIGAVIASVRVLIGIDRPYLDR